MKIILLINILISLSGILTAQTTIELKASRDVSLGYHDNYNSENRNYGDAIQNAAYYIPGFTGGINSNRALIDFDFSSVPSGAVISKATISLFAFKNYPEGTMVSNGHFGKNSSYLRRVTSSWDEYTATWNTQPQATSENQVILHQSNDSGEDYIDIDVTALVIDMIDNPDESNGFLLGLIQETEYANLSFHSKEGTNSAHYPVLKITFQIDDENPPTPIDPPSEITNEDNMAVYPQKPQIPTYPTVPPSDITDEDSIDEIAENPEIPINPHDFDFIIYPNPGRKMLKIEFKDRDNKHIVMFTMEGKILFSLDSNELIQTIGVRDLAPGVYFIQCSNEFKTITRKYVKMAR